MEKRKQTRGIGTTNLSILEGTVISAFFPEAQEMTIKEIQERVDYSYERVNTALKSLTEKKIVTLDKKGKTLVYSLDLQHLDTELGFRGYLLERKIEFIKKHKILYQAINEIVNNPNTWMVVLFGSYSKGTESKNSDVDILCISHKKKETEQFIRSLKHRYNLNFSPVILPFHEFPNIKKDNLELWNDLKQYGIAFKGGDTFYFWMYKNEKN